MAYSLLKGGDIESALKQSEVNLEKCKEIKKPTDRALAHAYYNVGMSQFLLGDHDKALASFAEAQRVKSMGITEEAMVEAGRARMIAAAFQRFEERVALEASLGSVRTASATQPGAKSINSVAGPRDNGAGVPGASSGIEERLKRLDDLYRKKLITKVEYDRKRAEILKEM